jgi:hypothetical protein
LEKFCVDDLQLSTPTGPDPTGRRIAECRRYAMPQCELKSARRSLCLAAQADH